MTGSASADPGPIRRAVEVTGSISGLVEGARRTADDRDYGSLRSFAGTTDEGPVRNHDPSRVVVSIRQRHPEHLGQIRHLRRRQISRVQPAQQQIEFCRLFQLLDREHRGFQRVA